MLCGRSGVWIQLDSPIKSLGLHGMSLTLGSRMETQHIVLVECNTEIFKSTWLIDVEFCIQCAEDWCIGDEVAQYYRRYRPSSRTDSSSNTEAAHHAQDTRISYTMKNP